MLRRRRLEQWAWERSTVAPFAAGHDVKCLPVLSAQLSPRLGFLLCLFTLVLAPAGAGRAQQTTPPTAAHPGQDDHAPRAYAINLGGSYAFLSRLPLTESGRTYRPAGVQIGGRFGWQVRGLRGGAPSTIGIESDFSFLPGRGARSSYGLIYGVFAKHSFTSSLRARPYFAYGLGAAQIWVAEVHGRGIGHATRIAVGLDTRLRERLYLSFALSYQGIIMPSFALKDRPARDTSFHSLVLSTGLWFGA